MYMYMYIYTYIYIHIRIYVYTHSHAVLARLFSVQRMGVLEKIVQEEIAAILQPLRQREEWDAVADFAKPLPVVIRATNTNIHTKIHKCICT